MQQKQKIFRVQTQPQSSEIDIQKDYQNYNRRKLKSLFYVKSKNTQKYFKNHPYFQTITQGCQQGQQSKKQNYRIKQHKKSIINQHRLKTQNDYPRDNKNQTLKSNQFVNYPTNYGLQNTYNYLQSKSFLNDTKYQKNIPQSIKKNAYESKKKARRYSLTQQKSLNADEQYQKNNNYMKNTAAYQSKFLDKIKHSKSLFYSTQRNQNIIQGKKPSVSFIQRSTNHQKRKISRVSNITNTNIISKSKSLNQPLNYSRNIIYNAPKQQSRLQPLDQILKQNNPATHQILVIYGKRIKSFQQISYRQIKFDILPYIINSFLKCKIRYKEMTQKQYTLIKAFMLKTLQTKQKQIRYDIKDIVNLSSIKAVLEFLEQFQNQQKQYEWVETIKYFFVTKQQKVLEYQLNKIKDQIAKLISIKFDAEFGQKQLFIFNTQTKKPVQSFYDLLKGDKYLIGDQQDVLKQYQAILNQKFQQLSLQQKISKWKSVAEISKDNKNSAHTTNQNSKALLENNQNSLIENDVKGTNKLKFFMNRPLSQQRFNNLFQKFKVRQKKRLGKSLSTNSNAIIVLKSPNNSFIDKSKLKKENDIFQ